MNASLKKNILIGILSLAGLVLLAALVWFLWHTSEFGIYKDDQYKFSIKYPKAWKLVKHPKENVAVVFLRPKDTALDVLQENFNVTVQPVPIKLLVLSDFTAKAKAQMLAVFKSNIRIAHEGPLQWGWRQGYKIIFEAPQPDHMVMVNAWVLKDGQAYIMTFLGDMNKYSKDARWVDEMILSLRLL